MGKLYRDSIKAEGPANRPPLHCTHPLAAYRVVREEWKERGSIRFLVKFAVCGECGRESERIVINPDSVEVAEKKNVLRALQRSAGQMFADAMKAGLLVRPSTCERCGAGGDIHGHHYDYSRPLEVEWLCRTCHASADDDRRAAEAAA